MAARIKMNNITRATIENAVNTCFVAINIRNRTIPRNNQTHGPLTLVVDNNILTSPWLRLF